MKKLNAFIFFLVFFVATACIGQSKPTEPSFFSIKIYDVEWFNNVREGDLKIKDPKWYVKNTCNTEDVFKERATLQKYWGTRNVTIKDEYVSVLTGKVDIASITVSAGDVTLAIKNFYRHKEDCLKFQEQIREWVAEVNELFESSRAKYK